jgi:hypothetical protein
MLHPLLLILLLPMPLLLFQPILLLQPLSLTLLTVVAAPFRAQAQAGAQQQDFLCLT